MKLSNQDNIKLINALIEVLENHYIDIEDCLSAEDYDLYLDHIDSEGDGFDL